MAVFLRSISFFFPNSVGKRVCKRDDGRYDPPGQWKERAQERDIFVGFSLSLAVFLSLSCLPGASFSSFLFFFDFGVFFLRRANPLPARAPPPALLTLSRESLFLVSREACSGFVQTRRGPRVFFTSAAPSLRVLFMYSHL